MSWCPTVGLADIHTHTMDRPVPWGVKIKGYRIAMNCHFSMYNSSPPGRENAPQLHEIYTYTYPADTLLSCVTTVSARGGGHAQIEKEKGRIRLKRVQGLEACFSLFALLECSRHKSIAGKTQQAPSVRLLRRT